MSRRRARLCASTGEGATVTGEDSAASAMWAARTILALKPEPQNKQMHATMARHVPS